MSLYGQAYRRVVDEPHSRVYEARPQTTEGESYTVREVKESDSEGPNASLIFVATTGGATARVP